MSLIKVVSSHYSQGWRTLLLDLHQTIQIELSGLFVSIAQLYSGQTLPISGLLHGQTEVGQAICQ